MNNYYLLIYLSKELRNKLSGSVLEKVITPYRDTLEFYLFKDEKFRLIFSADTKYSCLFTDRDRPAKKSNTIEFFDTLYGKTIKDVHLVRYDRFINLIFEDEQMLSFRLFGPNPNALLIEDGTVIDAFRQPEKEVGKTDATDREVTFFEQQAENKQIRDKIIGMNPLVPRDILNDLIKVHKLDQKSDEELISFCREFTAKLQEPECFRVTEDYGVIMLSNDFLPSDDAEEFQNADDAIRYAYRTASRENRIEDEKEDLSKVLKRKIKKVRSKVKGLRKAEGGLKKADLFENYGHLLMASAHLPAGNDSIEVEDFYNEGAKLKIPLKKGKNIAENAEYYYAKAKSSRESYEQSRLELPKQEKELERVTNAQESLEHIENFSQLKDWKKEYAEFVESGNKQKQESKPYFEAQAGTFSVWIGKNAKSNDALLQLSHKEDIWLHARGVGGSHVIIRMNNNTEYPPPVVIEQAASYAAFNSKLKGSELVPVIYTKRKFIRKPKGAAPGLVKVDREDVVMVKPEHP